MARAHRKRSIDEILELAESRAQTYKFLAALYSYEPLPTIAKSIKDKSFLDGISGDSKGFKLLKKFVEDSQGNDNLLEDLEVEHTALFVIPKFVRGRPYESFYLDPEQKVGARITIAVSEFYKRAGAEFTSAIDELADYIAIELEFMHFLCTKEKEAWQASDKDKALGYLYFERIFLKEHLRRWYREFCDDIYKDATSDFFRGASKITREYLDIENKDIAGLVYSAEYFKER
ncbi:MAG: molecular chaperone TorD family protein [Candidatus Hydrothermarchaeales archaeon]